MFSKFFIDRPIFATVLALLLVFAGILTVRTLPIAQYPDITPPTVMVSASYPGADASTVARAVGVPVEEQVNGVDNMLYMSSSCGSDGSYMLTVTFENGTDVDQAAVDVQNRVSRATPQLPEAVTQQGVSVTKRSSNNVLFISLETDRPDLYNSLFLTNYAQIHMTDPLSRVEGVGGVQAFGTGDYSMRVWLDPEAMRIRGLTPSDIEAAIRQQNMQVSGGSVGAPPRIMARSSNTQSRARVSSRMLRSSAISFSAHQVRVFSVLRTWPKWNLEAVPIPRWLKSMVKRQLLSE